MELIQQAAQLLGQRLGLSVDQDTLQNAVGALLGDGGSIDVAELVGRMAGTGQFGDILQSWLGDGENAPIDAGGILEVLGSDRVADFAGAVGTDTQTAAAGLSDVLPQLVDQASSGGNLLDAVGGVSGLMGAASAFLKR